jgi:hypothetical protein
MHFTSLLLPGWAIMTHYVANEGFEMRRCRFIAPEDQVVALRYLQQLPSSLLRASASSASCSRKDSLTIEVAVPSGLIRTQDPFAVVRHSLGGAATATRAGLKIRWCS